MKNKIALLTTFIILVSLLITMNVIFHESLRSDFADIYNKQQVLVSKGISSSIETAIDREVGELKFLSGILSEYPIDDKEKIKEIIKANFNIKHKFKTDITLFNSRRDVLFSTRPTGKQAQYFGKVEKLDLREVAVFYDMERVYAIAPIFRKGLYVGGILLEIKIKDLAVQFLSPFKSMQKGSVWLMDGDGNLLYHPTEEAMIANNLYRAEPRCFKCHSSFELEKKVLQGSDVGSGRYIAPTKEDKILAFSKLNIGKKTWIICVTSPYTEVISVMGRSMTLYSVLVVSIFATVFLAASMIVLTNRKRAKLEKEAREAIILEHEKLDIIVSAIGAGLALVNIDHEILWCNKTMGEWTKKDVVGKKCEEICPLCPPRVMDGEISYDLYKGLFGKKQQVFQITSAPVRNMEGKINGVLKLIQDVTAVKKLEEQVLHSQKLAALGRLAAGVAHEIGNPLTSISSFVQILKNRAQDDFSKENLDIIHHHIQRISVIVRQMSQFSKLPEMNIKEIRINDVIDSSLEIIRFDKKLQKVEILKEIKEDLPSVYVDHDYLVQVLINLLLNAADALENGGGTIYIRSMQDNNSVVVQLADTGIGIPEEYLGIIFDPFFTTKEKGTGLGLSLSYEIIKKFGGDLTVTSEEGAGTVFSIILPVMRG
ncbi:MAG TPA: hypothetical protein DEQ20_02605 [Desulfobulbaceae bacterium]|nr:hypothetical protein [Desulfobulbaceae bacterium]